MVGQKWLPKIIPLGWEWVEFTREKNVFALTFGADIFSKIKFMALRGHNKADNVLLICIDYDKRSGAITKMMSII